MEQRPADGLPVPARYWAILTIALGLVMAVLDGAIANVALPTIARDLQASAASSIWVVNAYQLAVTVSLLPLASLGEIIGYRRVYQAGLAVFTVASLLCARSDGADDTGAGPHGAGVRRLGHHERQHGADPLHLPASDAGHRDGHQRASGGGLLGGRPDRRLRHPIGRRLALAVLRQRADRRRRVRPRLARLAAHHAGAAPLRPRQRRPQRARLRLADHRDRRPRPGREPPAGGGGAGARRRWPRSRWCAARRRARRRCCRSTCCASRCSRCRSPPRSARSRRRPWPSCRCPSSCRARSGDRRWRPDC